MIDNYKEGFGLMKRLIGVVVGLLILCALPLANAEMPMNADPALTVTGSASVGVAPDFAVLNLGINTQGETALVALNQNAALMQSVIEALEGFGVVGKDLQTNYFGIYPIMDYNQVNVDGTQKMLGYRVENTIQVIVRDISHVSMVLDGAIAAGANQSYGINFDSSKRSEAYDQAMAAAVRDANRKAALLASAAEMRLGALVHITEQPSGYSAGYASLRNDESFTAGTPIMNGTLTVEAHVVVSYQLQ